VTSGRLFVTLKEKPLDGLIDLILLVPPIITVLTDDRESVQMHMIQQATQYF
jgi:hypothetical protein